MIELLQHLGYAPAFAVWELTLRCNLRCLHCGSYAGAARDDELGLAECLQVADDLAALGCRRMTLGGGEPTLHPHWSAIGRRLSDQGVLVNLISNGWAWTQEQVDQAFAGGLGNIGFSVDGLAPAHDTIRRAGSFERVMAAIDLCLRAGMPVAVATHINQLNAHGLRELGQALRDHGVSHWQLQLGTASGHLREHGELLLPPEDLLWLIPEIAELRTSAPAGFELQPAHNLGYYGPHETALRADGSPLDVWIGCRAGCQVIGIESNGNVKGCLSLPSARHGQHRFVEGNLREARLPELWSRAGAFTLNRTFRPEQLGGFCAACRYRDICRGGCAWTAYDPSSDRFDNRYCFSRQAVRHRRLDLLGDDVPTAEELAAIEPPAPAS